MVRDWSLLWVGHCHSVKYKRFKYIQFENNDESFIKKKKQLWVSSVNQILKIVHNKVNILKKFFVNFQCVNFYRLYINFLSLCYCFELLNWKLMFLWNKRCYWKLSKIKKNSSNKVPFTFTYQSIGTTFIKIWSLLLPPHNIVH